MPPPQSTLHEAFQCHSVVPWRSVPFEVQSLAVHEDTFLVGTNQGQLLVYECPPTPYGEKPPAKLKHMKRDFLGNSRKAAITQLLVVPEFDLLISLADSIIYVHTLDNFRCLTCVDNSKGTLSFAADVQVKGSAYADTHPTSAARKQPREALALRLCCVLKRKLAVFEWREDNTFHALKDFTLPETPRAVVWSGRRILTGFRREYDLIDASSGKIHIVVGDLKSSAAEPLAVRLPNNEFLLGIEDNGFPRVIFKDIKGFPSRNYGVPWQNMPSNVELSDPYLLGLTSNGVEVRTADKVSRMVQLIDLPKATHMCQGNSIFVVSPSSCWVLQPVPVDIQVDSMVAMEDFAAASKLATMMPDEEKRLKRVSEIKLQYALSEFKKKHFAQALGLLQDLDFKALRLYPWLWRPQAELEPVPGMPQLSREERTDATEAFAAYLTERRKALYAEIAREEGANITADPEALAARQKDLEEIDTALLNCHLQTKPKLVASLVRMRNNCELTRSKQLLQDAGLEPELVLLYRSRGKHRQALDLLTSNMRVSGSLHGMSHITEYLQRLGPEHIDLLLKYSTPVLKENPSLGLSIFMSEDYPTVKSFPRERVLQHLKANAPGLLVRYLEHVTEVWQDQTPEVHTELASAYFNDIKQEMEAYYAQRKGMPHAPLGSEPGTLGKRRQKLYDFLKNSSAYKPEKLLSPIYQLADGFHEERAILLGRIGRHHEALEIFAHVLKDSAAAEEYCQRYHMPDDESASKVFMHLLSIYLRPPDDSAPQIQQALDVLRKYHEKVDPTQALEMLPLSTKICNLREFLSSILQERASMRRQTQVLKNLYKAEHLQVNEKLIRYHSRHFKITEMTSCFMCRKPIRTHAFAVYPCAIFVHLHCMENEKQCPRHPDAGSCVFRG